MTDSELLALIEQEESNSIGMYSGLLAEQRRKSMQYYHGQPYGNEIEGRSQVVTTEVLDAVEGILPSLLSIFTSSEEIVRFEPEGPGDEAAAQQATDYINYVFSRSNNGFVVLYCLFKDALLQKNGFAKAYWEAYEDNGKESYQGLSDDEFTMLMQEPELELIEHTADQSPFGATHDATFRRSKKYGKTCILPVPPEEMRVSRDTPNDLSKARFVEQSSKKSISELRSMGFKISDDITDNSQDEYNIERVERKSSDDQNTTPSEGEGPAREVWVREAYLRVDYDDDGLAELRKITVVGTTVLDNEEADSIPFVTGTPIMMPHKLFGLSISDLVMDIQLIKSTITRQLLDNAYLANNGRYEALDGMVNMDDLLTNRPGGIVRVKALGSVKRIDTPLLGSPAFSLLEYFDGVKTARVGVNPPQMASDPNALNAKAHTAEIMNNAAMQRIELIARILAETAVKDLFWMILELESKHQSKPKVVKLRNKWVQIDPREWKNKFNMTVTVGLGTGSQQTVLNGAMGILQIQQGMAAGGLQGRVVSEQNAYAAGHAYAKGVFPKTADLFFTDPSTLPPPQPPPVDPKIQLAAEKAKMQDAQKQKNMGMTYQMHQEDLQHEAGMQMAGTMGQAVIKGIDVASQTNMQAMQHGHDKGSQAVQVTHEHVQSMLDKQAEKLAQQQQESEAQSEKKDQNSVLESLVLIQKQKEDGINILSDGITKLIEAQKQQSDTTSELLKLLAAQGMEKAKPKKRSVSVKRDEKGNLVGADVVEA